MPEFHPVNIPVRTVRPNVPDGVYNGIRGGYYITSSECGGFQLRTALGVRGVNIPVRFRIVGGALDPKSLEYTD